MSSKQDVRFVYEENVIDEQKQPSHLALREICTHAFWYPYDRLIWNRIQNSLPHSIHDEDKNTTRIYFLKWSCFLEYYAVSRECANDTNAYQLDQCLVDGENYTQYNYTFFTYGSSCCYSYTGVVNGVIYQSFIFCLCRENDCNGDLPRNMPALQVPSACSSLHPVIKLSIGVVAMITVLSKSSWFIFKYDY